MENTIINQWINKLELELELELKLTEKVVENKLITLSIETLVAFFPNIIFLFYLLNKNEAQFGQDLPFSLALASAGLFTVIPLLMFNAAATRLPLTITGLLQYITPSIMFLVGIIVFHEPLPISKVVGFIFIWAALAFLGTDLIKSSRATD